MAIKRCNHFKIQELVPPLVYADRGELAWQLMDPRLLEIQDILRDRYGPCFVNTWALSERIQEAYGLRVASGLRVYRQDPSGFKQYSQHPFGRATDSLFQDHKAAWIRDDIAMNPLPYPVTLEGAVDWLHLDVRPSVEPLTIFLP